jgi:hypothetical protein
MVSQEQAGSQSNSPLTLADLALTRLREAAGTTGAGPLIAVGAVGGAVVGLLLSGVLGGRPSSPDEDRAEDLQRRVDQVLEEQDRVVVIVDPDGPEAQQLLAELETRKRRKVREERLKELVAAAYVVVGNPLLQQHLFQPAVQRIKSRLA